MTPRADRRARFEGLWDEHHSRMLAYCMRRVPATDAEDACAEIFLVAWRRLDEVPPPPKSVLYLYGIAGRVVSNQERSFRRKSRLDERLRNLGVAPAGDPAVLVVQGSEDEIVARAVRNLKPKDREIVMLYAWEDLPRESIAEIMGMTRDAVDQRIRRAYKHLARVLEPSVKATSSPPVAEQGGI